jgi:hypothetical protein
MILWGLLVSLTSSILPMGVIVWGAHTGRWDSHHVRNRAGRLVPSLALIFLSPAVSLPHPRPGHQIHRPLRCRFAAASIRVLRTPPQTPKANAFAEQWILSVRRECTDQLLIFSQHHLQTVMKIYTGHFNDHRPHRSLAQRPPTPRPRRSRPATTSPSTGHDCSTVCSTNTATPHNASHNRIDANLLVTTPIEY